MKQYRIEIQENGCCYGPIAVTPTLELKEDLGRFVGEMALVIEDEVDSYVEQEALKKILAKLVKRYDL